MNSLVTCGSPAGRSFNRSPCVQGSVLAAAHPSDTRHKNGIQVSPLLPMTLLPASKPGEERNLPEMCRVRSQALEGLQQLTIMGYFAFSLPHFIYQQQNTGVFYSFLRFNSRWESFIHQGLYSPGPSNPDGFCSCASLVPAPVLSCHATLRPLSNS